MNRTSLVLKLLLCCAVALSIVGCDEDSIDTSQSTEMGMTAAVTSAAVATSTTTTAGRATAAWTNLNPSGSPIPPRTGHSMVYDSGAERAILFGGALEMGYATDTWTYDSRSNAWTRLHPSGDLPPGRYCGSMVYDDDAGQVILFGGGNRDNVLNDTWAYDPNLNTWTELHPTGELPPTRLCGSMVYDTSSGGVVLFGGLGYSDDFSQEWVFNDTWAYDPNLNTWTELHPAGDLPPPRQGHSMVYHSATGRVILYGGYDGSADFDDTWAYDPNLNTWTELHPAGETPPARRWCHMVYDAAIDRVVLFGGDRGGLGDSVSLLGDTWLYDVAANTWSEVHPAGDLAPARMGHSMVYDSRASRVVLMGGAGSDGLLNDTWALNLKS